MTTLYKTALCAIILAATAYTANIHYPEKYVKLIAIKNISSIQSNYEKARKIALILKATNDSYSQLCAESGKHELRRLKKDFNIFSHPKRKKRGIKLLGDLISSLTDIPGPDKFHNLEHLVKDLKKTTLDQTDEIINLHSILKQDESTLIKDHKDILDLYKNEKSTNHALNSFYSIITHHLNASQLCEQLKSWTLIVRNEHDIVKDISASSDNHHPSVHLFPKQYIKKAFTNLASFYPTLKPIFAIEGKFNNFYSTPSTITARHETTIISIATVPLIDFSKSRTTRRPTFEEVHSQQIQTIQNIANVRISHIITDKNNRFASIFAPEDFELNCNKIPLSPDFICKSRYHESAITNDTIPTKLVYEHGPNHLIITNPGKIDISCNNYSHSNTYNNASIIIYLPPNCSLTSNNLFIEKAGNVIYQSYQSALPKFTIPKSTPNLNIITPPPMITLKTQPPFTLPNNVTLTDHIKNLINDNALLNEDEAALDSLDSHDQYQYITIGVSTILCISFCIFTMYIYCKFRDKFNRPKISISTTNNSQP